jgi:hypothetical protein
MAIDVVGYSRLMGEDETGTAQAVRQHREAVRPVEEALRRGLASKREFGRRAAQFG